MTSFSPKHQTAQQPGHFSRRNFLRGVGACLSLPMLEALAPASRLLAATAPSAAQAVTATGAPLRTAFVYFPNGANLDKWWPTGEGKDFVFNSSMEPLADLRQHLQVMSGLDHLNATAGPDGPGDHARANATFLTGVRVRKTSGSDIHAGVSIDQALAQQIGHLTRFPSLELSCDSVRKAGSCDSGYSCAYQFNLAWSSAATPVAPEANPRQVFERMFGSGAPHERGTNLRERQELQRSLLDFVMEDTRALQKKISREDRHKLDQYLSSVRAVEQRISQAENLPAAPELALDTPAGIPKTQSEHIQLMFDMMLLAFQTDSTRVATFLLAADGANRPFPEINVAEGHHHLSHHGRNAEMLEKIARIDRFYVDQFAQFLRRMEETRDLDGNSLLHNSQIVYGGGIGDGDRHNHDDLPIIVAGHGGGTLSTGRFVKQQKQPMTNLFLSMADRTGVKFDNFGDSTGQLKNL